MSEEFEAVERSRLIIPGLAGLYERLAPLGYALVRVATGLLIVPGGYEKLFLGGAQRIAAGNVMKVGVEPAIVWAWAVGATEFFGALLLAIGLWTRPAAFSLVVLLTLVCLAYLFGRGGRWSLDRRFGREF